MISRVWKCALGFAVGSSIPVVILADAIAPAVISAHKNHTLLHLALFIAPYGVGGAILVGLVSETPIASDSSRGHDHASCFTCWHAVAGFVLATVVTSLAVAVVSFVRVNGFGWPEVLAVQVAAWIGGGVGVWLSRHCATPSGQGPVK